MKVYVVTDEWGYPIEVYKEKIHADLHADIITSGDVITKELKDKPPTKFLTGVFRYFSSSRELKITTVGDCISYEESLVDHKYKNTIAIHSRFNYNIVWFEDVINLSTKELKSLAETKIKYLTENLIPTVCNSVEYSGNYSILIEQENFEVTIFNSFFISEGVIQPEEIKIKIMNGE